MDRIIRAIDESGYIKMAVVSSRDMVEQARRIHGCSPTAIAALGRSLSAASMLGEMLKEEKASITLRINGGGPIGSIVAVSDSKGFTRGYVDEPMVDLPLRSDGKLNVGGAVGRDGLLVVSRDLGMREPYIGSTELISGEIAEDVTKYLLESEQVPSACALGVLVDTDCSVKAAGGFIAQLMPGAPMELIDKLEENIFMMDQLTTILDEDSPEEVFAQVLKGINWHIVGEVPVGYRCYCSRERVAEAIACVGTEELENMIDEGREIEVLCQFCGEKHIFTVEELKAMLDAAQMQNLAGKEEI